MATWTTVCSFVTRGEFAHQATQGIEILWFTHLENRGKRGDPDNIDFLLINTIAGQDSGKSEAASLESIRNNLFLEKDKDLRLVRRGKKIIWTADTCIEAFLWRTVENVELGFETEVELLKAQQEKREPVLKVTEEQMKIPLGHFREVERKLGGEYHFWEALGEMDDPAMMPQLMYSTAYYSVVLPLLLDNYLGRLEAVDPSATDFTHLCLEVLFAVVSKQTGRASFKFWPPELTPDPAKPDDVPDAVFKYRSMAYWIDVVVWHLRRIKPNYDPPVALALVNSLKRVRPLISDNSISILGFEKATLLSISQETTKQKVEAGLLEKVACARILERPAKEKAKRGLMHIVTIGCHPTVYGTLRELIHYLLTSPSHPYAPNMPGIRPISKEQQQEWLDRPNDIRITILETRPTCSGALLAQKLHAIVETSSLRARQLRELSRSYSDPHGVHSTATISPTGVKLAPGLVERLKLNKSAGASMGGVFGTLDELMRAAEEKELPTGTPNVVVEVVPDAALVSILSVAQPGLIVLFGVDRVLPGDCDLVGCLGSFLLAWYTKEQKKGAVFALVPTWTVESSFRDPKPAMPMADADQLVHAWKVSNASKGPEGDAFAAKCLNDDVGTAKIINQASEVIPTKHVDALITEYGIMKVDQFAAMAKERGADELALCGKG